MSEEQLRTSARGWHGVQLATLGFIGFCGVVQDPRPENPMWLQELAGILAVAALVVACAATFLVARVAWPLYGGRADASLERDGLRLRRGRRSRSSRSRCSPRAQRRAGGRRTVATMAAIS